MLMSCTQRIMCDPVLNGCCCCVCNSYAERESFYLSTFARAWTNPKLKEFMSTLPRKVGEVKNKKLKHYMNSLKITLNMGRPNVRSTNTYVRFKAQVPYD